MRILLVRHGETEWNRTERIQGASDIALNETGLEQARDTARHLGPLDLVAVYSSDLRRCVQTAETISARHGLDVLIEPDLREMDQGMFEGMYFSEVRENHADILALWREAPDRVKLPGGETLLEVQERMSLALERIASCHDRGIVVAVSHHFAISTALCKVMRLPLREFAGFQLKQGCISCITHDDGGFSVETVNETSHLREGG